MQTFDLSAFESYREDNQLEVKKATVSLPDSVWETYSAFANSYGGVIILGVTEKSDGTWKPTGLQDIEKIKKDFWNTINNKNKVSENLLTDKDVEVYNKDSNNILVIFVPKAARSQKPIFINNDLMKGSYRRNHEGDYRCTPAAVRAMLRDEPEQTSDMKILENFSMNDFSLDTVTRYRNVHKVEKPDHPWKELSNEDFLERLGAAAYSDTDGKLHPTAAGLLMFGEEYRIVREYPEYFLDYREELDPSIRWTDRLQSSSGEWSGNLFDFYFKVYNKIAVDIKKPFKLEGTFRVDDTPIHKAIREALVNCLVNADYFVPRGLVIRKTNEKLIFENPGYIRTGKYQMKKGGISDPRNKALMKMFNMIDIGERAGSGVPGIFKTWKDSTLPEPVIEEEFEPDRTRLTLFFGESSLESSLESSSTTEKIISLMKERPEITVQEIADKIGLSRRAITKQITNLQDKVEHIGSTKKGKWVVYE